MTTPPTIARFQAQSLACRRGGRLIFAGLGFDLTAGGALLLQGPNGSGKSSLLRLLAGLLPAERGKVVWGQRDGSDHRDAQEGQLHYVGHQDGIKAVLSVRENLLFWARMHQPAATDMTPALAAFALLPLADLPAKLLSAGQRRRLTLARLLAVPAPVWLLDEPSVGLDRESVVRLERVIADHRRQGGIVLLSTHTDLAVPDAQILRLEDYRPAAEPLLERWA